MGNSLATPFAWMDPVLYDEMDQAFTKADAEALAAKVLALHGAIGLSLLTEPPPTVRHCPLLSVLGGATRRACGLTARTLPQMYVQMGLHRMTVGAVQNGLHVPSSTLELGPAHVRGAERRFPLLLADSL